MSKKASEMTAEQLEHARQYSREYNASHKEQKAAWRIKKRDERRLLKLQNTPHLMLPHTENDKWCSQCLQWKPRSEFFKKLQYLSSICKSCSLCTTKQYYRDNKKTILAQAKTDRNNNKRYSFMKNYKALCGCYICGETDSDVLVYHHIDAGIKKFELSNFTMLNSVPLDDLMEELNKCLVVCHNCHHELHYNFGRIAVVPNQELKAIGV